MEEDEEEKKDSIEGSDDDEHVQKKKGSERTKGKKNRKTDLNYGSETTVNLADIDNNDTLGMFNDLEFDSTYNMGQQTDTSFLVDKLSGDEVIFSQQININVNNQRQQPPRSGGPQSWTHSNDPARPAAIKPTAKSKPRAKSKPTKTPKPKPKPKHDPSSPVNIEVSESDDNDNDDDDDDDDDTKQQKTEKKEVKYLI